MLCCIITAGEMRCATRKACHPPLGLTAGPTQGFGPLFGKALDGTPWSASPIDVFWGAVAGEYATGIGEANVVFSALTYLGSLGACGLGVAR